MHGCWLTAGDRRRFENGLNEANTEPLADFDSGFDSQLGFAVRAHCAMVLGLPSHVGPQEYWERRSQFTEVGLARLFLGAAGVSDWLVDTGFADGVADLAQFAEVSSGRAHEVVRLEQVAEQAAHAPGDYAHAFEEILHRRAATAVGTNPSWLIGVDSTEICASPYRPRSRRPRSGGARTAVSDYTTGYCCVSGCIRHCDWASRCNSMSGSETVIAICTRPIRCCCSIFSGSRVTPRWCCCTAIPTNVKPAI